MYIRLLMSLLLCSVVSACASTNPVIVGKVRPPIPADQVKIYLSPPPVFEDIAMLTASSDSVFLPGGQRQIDKVVARLKEEAAKLGGNGVILQGFSDAETASLGTGVGSESYSRRSAVGVGASGSFGVYKKTGSGRAIFVPPSAAE